MDRLPDVRIVGRAVGDLIHLLAELLENATSFAPPHTTVRVHAETVGNGLALQVEDRGLGMSETELAEANLRLAAPPNFDPGHSARLGLLVVGRLAARQGITVRLRPSSYGGVTAVVLVPEELVLAPAIEPSAPPIAQPAQPRELSARAFIGEDRSNQTTVSLVDGLPRRQRRAPAGLDGQSLNGHDGGEPTVTVLDEANTIANMPSVPAQRSADEVRSRMSAFQSGTVRGRAQAASPEQNSDPEATEERSA